MVQVEIDKEQTEKGNLETLPIINNFHDVFREEIPGLPPRRDIYFSIDVVSSVTPISRAPYRMSI